ncbi:MAG TPA: FtsX-like permease family protein [Opitutus sp.]|nr:FtsX-like permease family protein [Opitutus sp.]
MAWRDSRASRRRLVLVSLSIVLGIAALVGIASVGDNLQRTVEQQTKSLLGSDFSVTSRTEFEPEAVAHFRTIATDLAREVSLRSMITFPSRDHQRRLVQVRALEGGFPFYGELVTEPASAMAQLAEGAFVLVEDTILAQFGVKVGDEVMIGSGTFVVAGGLKKIPGESAAVAMFSPRVYLSMASLAAAGLEGRDSFASHRLHLKLPPGIDPAQLEKDMREKFKTQRYRYTTVEERKQDLGENLRDVYAFLSLVGFVALFLGAVGVASAMHVYVRQKIATVAVLRCLGASARTSFAIYLVQGFFLGLIGAVAGALLGIGVQMVLPAVAKDFLPFEVELFISWAAVARGAGTGLVICVLFALLPLLSVRRVSPLLAIRSAQGQATGPDPLRRWLLAGIGVAIAGFAILQAENWRVGGGFAAALFAAFGLLAGLARVIMWAAKRFVPRKALPYVWRQGLANLHRPNNRTVLLLLSLGLGTFLMTTLVLTRATLLGKIEGIGGGSRPNLVFFDVQEDQVARLDQLAQESGTPMLARAPMVTMRLTSLKGRSVEEWLRDDAANLAGWALRREYRSTYRGALSDTEKLTAGEFVGRVDQGVERVPVSMEEGLARDLQLKLGDELSFDVQGVPVACAVTSLRQVEWQRMQPNFFVVFPEGVLEPAPKTFIAALRTSSTEVSARLQQAVGRELPSVSAIDLALILQTFDSIFAKAAFVISFMAAFTVITGVIVLAGAILSGRFQRIRETVLLRTLGATRKQLRQIQFVEYAVLGVLAALTGGVLAIGANALLAKFVFKAPFVWSPLALLGSVAGAVAVTLVTGVVTNRGITSHPPLEVLRQET